MHCKIREMSGPCNFWTPIKSIIPDVWNWNCWTLSSLEIEVGGGGGGIFLLAHHIPPPMTTPLHMHMSHYKAKQILKKCFLSLQDMREKASFRMFFENVKESKWKLEIDDPKVP